MTNLAVPSQRTWSFGETVTAAMFNANIRDSINFGLNAPALIARATVQYNIPSGQWTPMSYETVDLDPYGGHSTGAPSRYTAPQPGVYRVSGQCDISNNANGFRSIRIQVNGGAQVIAKMQIPAINGVDTALVTTADVYLNTGDYVEIALYQNSGGTITTNTIDGQPRFTVMWEHA